MMCVLRPQPCAALRLGAALLTASCAMFSVGCTPAGEALDEAGVSNATRARGMGVTGRERLPLEAGAAGYPLQAAPLVWDQSQKLLASDAAGLDEFGRALALSGETAMIGAPGSDDGGAAAGSAYVFGRSASSWAQAQKLVPSDAGAGHWFGSAVALDGNIALVGAGGDGSPGSQSGAAYVFTRNAGSWTQAQKLSPGSGAPFDYFGRAVALAGDTALVGAFSDDEAAFDAGAAYVFTRSAGTWNEVQKLSASDAGSGHDFGMAVSVSGDTVMVGAFRSDGKVAGAGSVYVFSRAASIWTETQKLIASDGQLGDAFGFGLAQEGQTAVISAFGRDDPGDRAGAAYVFVRAASTWSQQQKLVASDAVAGAYFGTKVSLSGDTALIGAHRRDEPAGVLAGAAYVFVRAASTWAQTQKFNARDASANAFYGSGVAVSGSVALVGARGVDDAGGDSGAAYVMNFGFDAAEVCSAAEACASGHCVDGLCCDNACTGACEACDVAGLPGRCSPLPKGASPATSCSAYLCNGELTGCPADCTGDADCTTSAYCSSAGTCLPRAADGLACGSQSACLSGHCVDGVCCNEGCARGCGSCVAVGQEGKCVALPQGHPGTPSCVPHVCAGADIACPSRCASHDECAAGFHCAAGACQTDAVPGQTCHDDGVCATSHCTDGVCCVAEACGAYRCGSAGACELGCTSSAQCATGYGCASVGKCEAQASSAPESIGACHLARRGGGAPRSLRWLGMLTLLLGVARRRARAERLAREGAAEHGSLKA